MNVVILVHQPGAPVAHQLCTSLHPFLLPSLLLANLASWGISEPCTLGEFGLGFGRLRDGPQGLEFFVKAVGHIRKPAHAGSTGAQDVDHLGLVLGIEQLLVKQVAVLNGGLWNLIHWGIFPQNFKPIDFLVS